MGWLVYLVDILDTFKIMFCILAAIFVIAVIACYLVSVTNYDIDKDEEEELRKNSKKFLLYAIIPLMLGIITPRAKMSYMIIGVNTLQEIVENNKSIQELPQKSVDALNRWLDSIEQENKNVYERN